jgi:hypothetical protein
MWRPVPFPEDFCGEIGFLETRAPVKARAGSVLRGRGFRCRKQLHDRLPLKGGKISSFGSSHYSHRSQDFNALSQTVPSLLSQFEFSNTCARNYPAKFSLASIRTL